MENYTARVKQCQFLMKHLCSMQRSEQPKTNIISKSEVSIIRWIFLNVMEAFKDEFSDPCIFENIWYGQRFYVF